MIIMNKNVKDYTLQYFELICTAYLKNDIAFQKSFEVISKYVSFSMAQTPQLQELHNQERRFKYYTFGSFFPVERAKVYKKGSLYTFTLRSLDESFIDTLTQALTQNTSNPHFLVVETQKRKIKEFFISELYSVIPVVVSSERGLFWTLDRDGDIVKLQRLLHDNLEKKYNDFYGEKLKPLQNFIQLLEIKNQKPQKIWTKKGEKEFFFLGNKFKIIPNEDEVSQKLAFLALGAGLGEKNSFGGGFCVAKGMR